MLLTPEKRRQHVGWLFRTGDQVTVIATVKWKLKGSLESQLCWMVFCWGKCERTFCWSRRRWKADLWRTVSLKQAQDTWMTGMDWLVCLILCSWAPFVGTPQREYRASCVMFVGLQSLLRGEQPRTSGVPVGPGPSCWGLAVPTPTLLVYPWSVCEWVELPADLWPELLVSW